MCSVMHYGAWDFGQRCTCYQKHEKQWGPEGRPERNCTRCQTIKEKVESDQRGKMQTVLPKHNRFEKYCSIKEVGKRQNFTNEDIVKLNLLYDCDKGGIFCTHLYDFFILFLLFRCSVEVPRERYRFIQRSQQQRQRRHEGVQQCGYGRLEDEEYKVVPEIPSSVLEVMCQEVQGVSRLPLLDLLRRRLVLYTIHRFHNQFSQSRRRPLLGPSPG